MAFRIGSFNVMKMGRATNEKKTQGIARIIMEEDMSIVAFQEVFHSDPLDNIVRYLGKEKWDYRFELSRDSKEGYAFLWRKDRFIFPSTVGANGSRREFFPRILNQYKKFNGLQMIRNPYFGRFIPAPNTGESYYEIRLINAHIRFSGGKTDEEDNMDASSLEKRRTEFRTLTSALLPKYEDKQYGIADWDDYDIAIADSAGMYSDGSRPSYTILLGDYNLNIKDGENPSPYLLGEGPDYGETVIIEDKNSTKRIQTMQKEKTTIRHQKDGEEQETDLYANNYDHISVNSQRFNGSAKIDVYVVDAVQKYYGYEAERYRSEISDHLPIVVEFEIIRERR